MFVNDLSEHIIAFNKLKYAFLAFRNIFVFIYFIAIFYKETILSIRHTELFIIITFSD